MRIKNGARVMAVAMKNIDRGSSMRALRSTGGAIAGSRLPLPSL